MKKTETVQLSRSARKHIRTQKARIRRDIADAAHQLMLIRELYAKFGITR